MRRMSWVIVPPLPLRARSQVDAPGDCKPSFPGGRDLAHVRSIITFAEKNKGLQVVRDGERVVTKGALDLKAELDDREGD